jgi:hypothetical protein
LNTDVESIEESVEKVIEYLKNNNIIWLQPCAKIKVPFILKGGERGERALKQFYE